MIKPPTLCPCRTEKPIEKPITGRLRDIIIISHVHVWDGEWKGASPIPNLADALLRMKDAVTHAAPATAREASVTTNRLSGVRSNKPRKSGFAPLKNAMNGSAKSAALRSSGTRITAAYSAVACHEKG